jgi:hypothetical protein
VKLAVPESGDQVYIFVVGSCDGGNYNNVAKYCILDKYKYRLEF